MNDRIVDVLMVSQRVLDNPDVARRFMRAYYRGLELLESHGDEADIKLQKWLDAPKPEDVRAMRMNVRFMSRGESTEYISSRLSEVGDEISDLYTQEKLIEHQVSLRQAIDASVISSQ